MADILQLHAVSVEQALARAMVTVNREGGRRTTAVSQKLHPTARASLGTGNVLAWTRGVHSGGVQTNVGVGSVTVALAVFLDSSRKLILEIDT